MLKTRTISSSAHRRRAPGSWRRSAAGAGSVWNAETRRRAGFPAQVQETVARGCEASPGAPARVHQGADDLHVNARRLEKLLSHASPELGRSFPRLHPSAVETGLAGERQPVAVHAGRREPENWRPRASPPGRSSPVRAGYEPRAHADESRRPHRESAADDLRDLRELAADDVHSGLLRPGGQPLADRLGTSGRASSTAR